MLASRFGRSTLRAVTRHQFQTVRSYCTEEKKETPASKEDDLTAHFRLPQKGDGPEKAVYDLAEKVLSLNVLQFRLFQKIVNEAMGKSEMWEYDLVMNLAKGMAGGGGGGGGGGAFMMNPAMMQGMQAGAPAAGAPAAAAEPAEEEAAPKEEVKEKTEFDVKLTQIDPEKKVKAIKVLKEALKMSLKDAKEKVEGCPAVIAKGIPKADADKIIEDLKAVGATAAAM